MASCVDPACWRCWLVLLVGADAGGKAARGPPQPVVLSRLAASPQCDVGSVLVDRRQHLPQAVSLNYLRSDWLVRLMAVRC